MEDSLEEELARAAARRERLAKRKLQNRKPDAEEEARPAHIACAFQT